VSELVLDGLRRVEREVRCQHRVGLLGRVRVGAAVEHAGQLRVVIEDGGELVEGVGVLALLDIVEGGNAPRLRHAKRRRLRPLRAGAVELDGVALEQVLHAPERLGHP
jgi:hypothetical protein